MSEMSAYLSNEKRNYLEATKQTGGTARGFRELIKRKYEADKDSFLKMALDATMEATTHVWQRAPRRVGPDLFSLAGYTIPEYLTRPRYAVPDADDDAEDTEDTEDEEDEDSFEKVAQAYATVQDLVADATLKLRKAAQSATAAEREMKAADEALRRARGVRSALLADIADRALPRAAE